MHGCAWQLNTVLEHCGFLFQRFLFWLFYSLFHTASVRVHRVTKNNYCFCFFFFALLPLFTLSFIVFSFFSRKDDLRLLLWQLCFTSFSTMLSSLMCFRVTFCLAAVVQWKQQRSRQTFQKPGYFQPKGPNLPHLCDFSEYFCVSEVFWHILNNLIYAYPNGCFTYYLLLFVSVLYFVFFEVLFLFAFLWIRWNCCPPRKATFRVGCS